MRSLTAAAPTPAPPAAAARADLLLDAGIVNGIMPKGFCWEVDLDGAVQFFDNRPTTLQALAEGRANGAVGDRGVLCSIEDVLQAQGPELLAARSAAGGLPSSCCTSACSHQVCLCSRLKHKHNSAACLQPKQTAYNHQCCAGTRPAGKATAGANAFTLEGEEQVVRIQQAALQGQEARGLARSGVAVRGVELAAARALGAPATAGGALASAKQISNKLSKQRGKLRAKGVGGAISKKRQRADWPRVEGFKEQLLWSVDAWGNKAQPGLIYKEFLAKFWRGCEAQAPAQNAWSRTTRQALTGRRPMPQ